MLTACAGKVARAQGGTSDDPDVRGGSSVRESASSRTFALGPQDQEWANTLPRCARTPRACAGSQIRGGGDLVLALNDVEIHSAQQFREQLEKVSPGSEVRLRLERGVCRDGRRWE